MRYSLTFFGASSGLYMKGRVDPLLVGSLVGVAMVPIYSIGVRLLSIFNDLMDGLFGSHLMVAMSRVEGRDGPELLRERLLESTKISAVFTTFVGGSLAIFSGPFLTRWVGPQFADSYTVLLILIFPYVLFLSQYPSFSALHALAKNKFIMISAWAAALFNLLLSVLLGVTIGFFGIIWATFIEMVLLYGFVFPWGVSRATGIPIGDYYATIAFNSLKTMIPLALFYLLARDLLLPDYGRLAMLAALEIIIMGGWLWFFMLDPNQRKVARKQLFKGS